MNTKQVIVFRKDLLKGEHAIRKGKFGAQVAHGSLASLLQLFNKEQRRPMYWEDGCINVDDNQILYEYSTQFSENSVLNNWLNGKFTKIVVSIDSEEELKELNEKLNDTHIPHALIVDAGLTEFNGVPTTTCLGIGPYISEEIDKFTGNLSLL